MTLRVTAVVTELGELVLRGHRWIVGELEDGVADGPSCLGASADLSIAPESRLRGLLPAHEASVGGGDSLRVLVLSEACNRVIILEQRHERETGNPKRFGNDAAVLIRRRWPIVDEVEGGVELPGEALPGDLLKGPNRLGFGLATRVRAELTAEPTAKLAPN
jgi:hypothetical protein